MAPRAKNFLGMEGEDAALISAEDETWLLMEEDYLEEEENDDDDDDLIVALHSGQQQQQSQEPITMDWPHNHSSWGSTAAPPPPVGDTEEDDHLLSSNHKDNSNSSDDDDESLCSDDCMMIYRCEAFDEGEDGQEQEELPLSEERILPSNLDIKHFSHMPLSSIPLPPILTRLSAPRTALTSSSSTTIATTRRFFPDTTFHLDPQTTKLQDLEQMIDHDHYHCPDLIESVYETRSPRLICLMLQLLAHHAKNKDHLCWFQQQRHSKTVLPLITSTLANCNDWLGQEWAAKVIRTLASHSAMDPYLLCNEMAQVLVPTLSFVAMGGQGRLQMGTSSCQCAGLLDLISIKHQTNALSTELVVTEQARIHACVAIMNLSCGSNQNKSILANFSSLLHALKTILVDPSSQETMRIKAVTTLKNLSGLDTNDRALVEFPGLLHALGQIVWETTTTTLQGAPVGVGAAACTMNACLVLMNLSISKHYKCEIYNTPGIMQALLTLLMGKNVTESSSSEIPSSSWASHRQEVRTKACTVLSNLAIGYDLKIPMLQYPGFVDAILHILVTEEGEIQSKASSIMWSLAAEKANQVPLVQRGHVLPVLVHGACAQTNKLSTTGTTGSASSKCVAALALLAESPENAVPLLEAGVLHPLLDSLQRAGSDPTQWTDPTPSWSMTCILNLAQVDAAMLALRNEDVVSLLSPLVGVDHDYQSLKAAMVVTLLCCQLPDDEDTMDCTTVLCYDLSRKVEAAVPNIVNLLINTLAGRGGDGYKYGVFTLSSSLACIAALASGPEFIQECVCTLPVVSALCQVLWEFCVEGGASGSIAGGGREDYESASWAIEALHSTLVYMYETSGQNIGNVLHPPILSALVHVLQNVEHRVLREVNPTIHHSNNDGPRRLYNMANRTRHLIWTYTREQNWPQNRISTTPTLGV